MESYIGPNMNANSGNYDYFSGWAKVSFDGFINENYFSIDSKEKNLIQNLEIAHAITKNPITYQKDSFIGLILKSKFDGIGNRQPIDLSIALDISGSMSCIDGNDGKSRIKLAKESLKKLVSIMDGEKDTMSLITFNHQVQEIFGPLDKNEIQQKFLNDIDAIKARGGTDLVLALKSAMNNLNMENNNKKEKRIIMITDAAYHDVNDNLLNLFKQCVEEKGVSITIMAISSESNLELADKLSHYKGCNYFPITNSSELETFLVKYFNYIFFPIAYDMKITIKSENAQILKCIGGENELLDEYNNKIDSAPAPNNQIYFDLGSSFSSELLENKDIKGDVKLYSKGGLILFKINPYDLNKEEDLKFNITLEYKSFDNNTFCQNYSYIIENKKKEKENEYFKNNNMRKGISIYYFTSILNHIVEIYNKGNYNNRSGIKDENKKKEDLNLLETKQVVCDYLKTNFILEPNNNDTKNNLDNYLNLIEERYNGFTKVIYSFYNMMPAPILY